MAKEIELLIRICETDKNIFTIEELAAMLNLKYSEGIYPYIRKLPQLKKRNKGTYYLITSDHKVEQIRFFLEIYGKHTYDLLSIHTKRTEIGLICHFFSNRYECLYLNKCS